MLRNDPNEWANKKKAAVERAKQLRQERLQGGGGGESHTFKPQINERPAYLDKQRSSNAMEVGDSLDSLTRNDRPFDEQPLPGSRGKQRMADEIAGAGGATSLSAYVSKQQSGGGGSYAGKYESKKDIEHKKQFFSQYEESHKDRFNANPAPSTRQQQQMEAEPEPDAFLSGLRGGDRSSGSGWNNDTAVTGGFDDFRSAPARRTPGSASKEKAPAARVRAAPPSSSSNSAYDGPPSPNKTSQVRSSPGKSSDVVAARSRLSLLKSKIQRHSSVSSNETIDTVRSRTAETDGYTVTTGLAGRGSAGTRSQADMGGAYAETSRVGRQQQQQQLLRRDEYEDPPSARRGVPDNSHSGRPGSGTAARGGNRMDFSADYNDEPPRRAPAAQQRQAPAAAPAPSASSNTNRMGARPRPAEMRTEVDEYENNYNRGGAVASGRSAVGASNANAFQPNGFSAGAPAPSAGAFGSSSSIPDDVGEEGGPQMECPDCGRKFNPIPYQKHIKICAKVFLQKRKVFDSTKMRVADNPELVQIIKKTQKEAKVAAKAANQAAARQDIPIKPSGGAGGGGGGGGGESKWKQQSEAFRAALKAAKQYTQAKESGGPLPPPVASAPDPSLIPCPHCGRRFNEKAADRHIPQCQKIQAKPTSLKRGAGGGGGRIGTGTVAPQQMQQQLPARPSVGSRGAPAPSASAGGASGNSRMSMGGGGDGKPAPRPRR